MVVREDPQTEFEERETEDSVALAGETVLDMEEHRILYAAIADFIDSAEGASRHSASKRRMKDAQPPQVGLYRLGPYKFRIRSMSGGGHEVKVWNSQSLQIMGHDEE